MGTEVEGGQEQLAGDAVAPVQPRPVDQGETGRGEVQRGELVGDRLGPGRGGALLRDLEPDLPGEHLGPEVVARAQHLTDHVLDRRRLDLGDLDRAGGRLGP